MLEALVNLNDNGGWSRGDIICVKLSGSPWGSEEVVVHKLVQFEDQVLEDQLNEMLNNGDPYPVISCPYTSIDRIVEKTFLVNVYDGEGNLIEADKPITRKFPIMRHFSSKYIDLDAEESLPSSPSMPNHSGPNTSLPNGSNEGNPDIPTVTLIDKE